MLPLTPQRERSPLRLRLCLRRSCGARTWFAIACRPHVTQPIVLCICVLGICDRESAPARLCVGEAGREGPAIRGALHPRRRATRAVVPEKPQPDGFADEACRYSALLKIILTSKTITLDGFLRPSQYWQKEKTVTSTVQLANVDARGELST